MFRLSFVCVLCLFIFASCEQSTDNSNNGDVSLKVEAGRRACVWCQGSNDCPNREHDCWATIAGSSSSGTPMIQCNCTNGCIQRWKYCDLIGYAPNEQQQDYFSDHYLFEESFDLYKSSVSEFVEGGEITTELITYADISPDLAHYAVIYSFRTTNDDVRFVGYWSDGSVAFEIVSDDDSELIYDELSSDLIALNGSIITKTDLPSPHPLP